MVLKGFFANINMKLKKNLEVMDVGAELSIKSNPLLFILYPDPAHGCHLGSPNVYYTYLSQPGHKTSWAKSIKKDRVAKTDAYTELQVNNEISKLE